ncbi:hypothetical protein [Flectobacillus sp. BAB-3569]|uniref:hypothetical protein n=1 Tax=Flectobacillus sp. BAB-3569 TaxID=1509483 RepID=UPI001595A630|nr:hypothetical protein [Flectobacillus sp. BAB-3569]
MQLLNRKKYELNAYPEQNLTITGRQQDKDQVYEEVNERVLTYSILCHYFVEMLYA